MCKNLAKKKKKMGEGKELDFFLCILQLQQNNFFFFFPKNTVASQLPFQTFGPE